DIAEQPDGILRWTFDGQVVDFMTKAVEAAGEGNHVTNGLKARRGPHAGRIGTAGRIGIDVRHQAVIGSWVHSHQLQLMGVADVSTVFRAQEGPGLTLDHEPVVVEVEASVGALIKAVGGINGGNAGAAAFTDRWSHRCVCIPKAGANACINSETHQSPNPGAPRDITGGVALADSPPLFSDQPTDPIGSRDITGGIALADSPP